MVLEGGEWETGRYPEVVDWLRDHYSIASPMGEMVRFADLPERSIKRRFTKAAGYSPIAYVQRLRVEEAKGRLERTDAPVDDISWSVGYEEDPAFFRRLFKRPTNMTPGACRRMFRLPDFARPDSASDARAAADGR